MHRLRWTCERKNWLTLTGTLEIRERRFNTVHREKVKCSMQSSIQNLSFRQLHYTAEEKLYKTQSRRRLHDNYSNERSSSNYNNSRNLIELVNVERRQRKSRGCTVRQPKEVYLEWSLRTSAGTLNGSLYRVLLVQSSQPSQLEWSRTKSWPFQSRDTSLWETLQGCESAMRNVQRRFQRTLRLKGWSRELITLSDFPLRATLSLSSSQSKITVLSVA